MSVPMSTIRHGRTRRGRRKHGYWVPSHMRSKRSSTNLIVRVCGRCDLPKSHAVRTQGDGIRRYCVECEAELLREWRAVNWQRVKLRDTWRGMIDRCHNPERMKRWAAAAGIAGAWRDYGAAGVKVCDRWRGPGGFERFCVDVGDPPTKAHTLDRIRTTRDYSPSNCRWATKEVQDANRKNSVFVSMADPDTGEVLSLTIAAWCRHLGVARSTVTTRRRKGLPDVEVFKRSARRVVDPSVPF